MENILKNCHYIPMSTMKHVIEMIETNEGTELLDLNCKRSLLRMQQNRVRKKYIERDTKIMKYYHKEWKNVHQLACYKALYSHDWDKLLYLLKKCPPWEHGFEVMPMRNDGSVYIRSLLILLMYHKSSQAQGLLNEYLHLVWSCRSVEDKKAVLKILLTLPEKIQHIHYNNIQVGENEK